VVEIEDDTEEVIEIASMSWMSSMSMKYSSRIERGDGGELDSGVEGREKGDMAIVNILSSEKSVGWWSADAR
jgi:hypothetical protein